MNSRPAFIIVLSLILVVMTGGNSIGQKMIEWEEDKKLTWNDFTKVSNDGDRYSALTSYELSYAFYRGNGGWYPVVNCKFNCKESWVKKGREKKYILQHEQGHFDIAQIHARILRKRFEEIDWSRGRPDKSPQRVFDETFAECKAMQSQYDDETDHGTVDGEQSRWYQKIDHLLSEYKQYAE